MSNTSLDINDLPYADGDFFAFEQLLSDLSRNGELVTAEALGHPESSRIYRWEAGAPLASDGPYSETKEHLAGFFLIDVESQERAAARESARARREEIVTEAEHLAGQPEHKIQWKASSARMRALLDEWKDAQRQGPKLDRESEQALWHRLSSARNSFDKLRRVHFAQLSSAQSQA